MCILWEQTTSNIPLVLAGYKVERTQGRESGVSRLKNVQLHSPKSWKCRNMQVCLKLMFSKIRGWFVWLGLDIMTGCNVGSVWNNVSRCRHMVGERTNWTRAYPECIFLNILKRSYASCLYQYLYNFRKFNYVNVVGRRINVELKRCFMQSNINIIIWIIVYVSCLLKKYRYINLILRMHDKNYINFYKYIKYKKLYNYIKNYTLKRIFW